MKLLDMQVMPVAWNARVLRERLLGVASQLDMSSDCIENFLTAVSEAFANSVEHAETEAAVEIVITLEGEQRLLVTVRDHGKGIDGAFITNRLPPVGEERGRGIPLMRECTSSVRITVPPGGGTLVTLCWNDATRSRRDASSRANLPRQRSSGPRPASYVQSRGT